MTQKPSKLLHPSRYLTVCMGLFASLIVLVGSLAAASTPVMAAGVTDASATPAAHVNAQPALQPSPTKQGYEIRLDIRRPVLKVYKDAKLIHTYQVALGKEPWLIPIGSWKIVNKQRDWGGGFGSRWMGFNVPWGTYGIHGTNRPESIGTYASHGCIRMHNRDVEKLYNEIPVGTRVIILGNPLAHPRRLEYGNVGADVQLVQRQLARLGFYRGPKNGRFDQPTQNALMRFQLARKLLMDGYVSGDDYRALGLPVTMSQLR